MAVKKNSLISCVFTVMFFTVLAKVLSFVIELIIAYRFGANEETDTYYLVNGIIQIITPMITIGIWKVFMPAYKECLVKKNRYDSNILTNEMMLVFSMTCVGGVLMIECFPELVIHLFAPGFNGYKLELSVALLRIMSPMLIIITLAVFHSAILQANNEFTKSQIKYVFQHIPTLIYLAFFSSFLNIKYLSISLMVGELIAFMMVAFYTRNEYKFVLPSMRLSGKTIKVLKLVPAACLNSIISQINHIVDKAFCSILQTGTLTYLTYGNKVVSLFDGVVTTAFSTAFFPRLVELNTKENKKEMRGALSKYVMTLLCVLIPMMFIMLVYSNVIVNLVFGHGEFNDYSVSQTAGVLLVYSIGLIAMGMNTIFNDVLYIKKKTKILFFTNMINILVNIILNLLLIEYLQILGICLATTLSLYISMLIKIFYIKNEFLFTKDDFKQVSILVIGACLGGGTLIICKNIFYFNQTMEFCIGIPCFMIIYCFIVFRPGTVFNKMMNIYILRR